jgi:uncharacterized protein (TIGR03437 family)
MKFQLGMRIFGTVATIILVQELAGQTRINQSAAFMRPASVNGLRTPYFEANVGQFRTGVAYVFRGKDGAVAITDDGLEFPGGAKLNWKKAHPHNHRARAYGTNALVGKSHYLLGADRSKWRSNVQHFGELMVSEAFLCVDIRLYVAGGNLEYDLIIQPGVNLSDIRFEVSGWKRIENRPDGSVHFESAQIVLTQRPPFSFQRISGKNVPIASRFLVSADQKHITLASERTDQTRILVVDPVIEMSLLFGGNDYDSIYSVQTGADGNLYVCGGTRSTDLPVRSSDSFSSPFDFSQNGQVDAYFAKLSTTGDLLALTYLGGRGDEEAKTIAVAADSTVYIAGHTESTDFPARGGFDQSHNGSRWDGFIARLSADGSTLMSSTFLGGSGADLVRSLALAASGSVVVVGQTSSQNFPTTANLLPRTNPVYADAFAVQFDPTLTTLQFSTVFGGYFDEDATGVAVDGTGAIWMCGSTASSDFGVVNALETQRRGNSDGFLVKISANRQTVVTSTLLGGSGSDWPQSIILDATGDVYVSGITDSANFPVLLPFQGSLKGNFDAFISKINSAGTRILFSTYLGGSASDIVVVGSTHSLDFPVIDSTSKKATNSTADVDGFIASLSRTGNQLLFSMYVGGSSEDYFNAITHQGTHVVALGGTASANFPYTKAIKPNRRLPGIAAGTFDYDATIVRLRLDGEGTLPISIDGVRNAGSFDSSISPGTWVSIFGKNFLPPSVSARSWNSRDFVGNKLPDFLEGVSVLFDGRPGSISYVSATQLNVQVPDVPQSSLTRVDVRSSVGLASTQIAVKTSSPSLFTIAPSGSGRLVAAVFGDGTLVGNPNIVPGSRQAKPGDVILIFGTGFGATTPAQAAGFTVVPSPLRGRCTVRVGNQTAEVLYSGLVGPGLNQINVRVPNVGPGDYQLVISMEAEQTQSGVVLPVGR